MANKMRSARTTTPMGNLTPAPGVYGHSMSPTVSEYEQDNSVAGKFKTGETTMGGPMRQVNQMRTANSRPQDQAKMATSSNAKKTKNNYRRATNAPVVGKKSF